MLRQPRNAVFEREYSLESVTGKLSAAFPGTHVVAVKPSVMRHGDTFSCYENFVESADEASVPILSIVVAQGCVHITS